MKKYTLENLDCAECALNLERKLERLENVRSVSINFATSTMHIDATGMVDVLNTIKVLEPDVRISDDTDSNAFDQDYALNQKRGLIRIGIALILFCAGLIFRQTLRGTPYSVAEYAVFLSAYILSGWDVLFTAARNVVRGRIFDEHLLMSIATVGAIAINALPEAVGVMLFFKIGEYFEQRALSRSRRSIKSLLALKPAYANLEENGRHRRVQPEDVKVGDTILVKPGERVPLDGVITSGEARIDTSALTGESIPRRITEGNKILSGTVISSGSLRVRVTNSYNDSSISKIMNMVEHALSNKADTEKFITTFAKYYTPAIVALALGIAVIPPLLLGAASFREWMYRALVMLVVACPCALVISIPLGYFGGIGGASKKGILIKGSNFIDGLSRVRKVIFDKTGTLTEGSFKVLEVVSKNGYSERDILYYAAHAESHSNHPIADSIQNACHSPLDSSAVTEYREVAGHGIKAVVNNRLIFVGNDRMLHEEDVDHDVCDLKRTAAYVVIDRTYAGYIIIGDEIKPGAERAVRDLQKLNGIETIMLTGDNKKVSEYVAKNLGIDAYYAELLPEEKVQKLVQIQSSLKERETVAFVGDGINDAPVIAQSDIGIAMGRFGSEIAIDSADVVLMSDSPEKVPEAIGISKKTRNVVYQNIIIALAIKLVFVVLGVAGVAEMWEAVFADVGVTLIAIFNALRVLR
jgi:Cd2+/Zn2+-exporting ATPase